MAPDRGLAAAEPAAALMAPQLDWSEARTRAELDGFRSLVAAQRAGERQPDDAAALGAYRAALAAAPAPRGGAMTAVVLGVDQGTSSTRCLVFDEELNELSSATAEVGSRTRRLGWSSRIPSG